MSANNTPFKSGLGKGRLIFGIFMVVIYVGVGILCLLNIDHGLLGFGNSGIMIALGILLIVYGIWRGYRLYKGTP